MSQVEHLLAEYRKLGPIGNFDVALLYQTRKCLFVEGASDLSWLQLIAARLASPLFTGVNQFVIFQFKGAEKFTLVKDLAERSPRGKKLEQKDAEIERLKERVATLEHACPRLVEIDDGVCELPGDAWK